MDGFPHVDSRRGGPQNSSRERLPYKNLESFLSKTDEKCVRDWILDLYAGSKGYVTYVLHLIE